MTAQRHDAAAGTADIAEQELHDRRSANILDADRMVGPADRIGDRARSLAPRVDTQCLGDADELLLRCAADALDHLGRVPAKVLLEQLKDAAWMLQRAVDMWRLAIYELLIFCLLRRVSGMSNLFAAADRRPHAPPSRAAHLHVLVLPAGEVVTVGFGFEAGEHASRVVRVGEAFVDDDRRIRIMLDVFVEPAAVFQDVMNDTAEECDIAAGTDFRILRCDRARTREARVDVNHFGAALASFHDPLEADRVRLGHIRTHDENAVAVL